MMFITNSLLKLFFISIYCEFFSYCYSNKLFTIASRDNYFRDPKCGMFDHVDRIANRSPTESTGGIVKLQQMKVEGSNTTSPKKDPITDFDAVIQRVIFGKKKKTSNEDYEQLSLTLMSSVEDPYLHYPSGKYMRGEAYQNISGVHLPSLESLHSGHCRLKVTKDYMQTAIDAFAILAGGNVEDVMHLPSNYILNSARTIAMMKIAREKLVATWFVVKGDKSPKQVTFETLSKFRPLFKYVHGREMARLNLTDTQILTYIGTHPELNRYQMGVVASQYIQLNPQWTEPRYLNLMNNLLCGVPMLAMRNIPISTYLQLTHQLFYHTRACDPLQRRFYLSMMTRTQVLGKSYSWTARDVSRLGLLLADVTGQDLSAINPRAMAGITSQVMLEMPVKILKYITEKQLRFLNPQSYNILARKLAEYQRELIFNIGHRSLISSCILVVLLYLCISIKLLI